MKFATTEKTPVRYEARAGTWVEHARPESVEVGEVAVYCSGPERLLKKSIYAGIYLHLGSGCYAIELVEGGRSDSAFEERVFAERLDYPTARRVLLEKLREMGVDTEAPELLFPFGGPEGSRECSKCKGHGITRGEGSMAGVSVPCPACSSRGRVL